MIDLSPYRLVIFDKDGTLIDFDAMWGGWVEALAARLEAATGRALAPALFQAFGYDSATRRTIAGGQLAFTPMAGLYTLTGQVLADNGLQPDEIPFALRQAWYLPDPVGTSQPLVDLSRLFGALRQRGFQIAIATSDDHVPTTATLSSLGVLHLVTAIIAADDGLPPKPAPDMILAACRLAQVDPRQAIMVGDSLPDLQMARAAGAGLAVGVASGVSSAELLSGYADVVVANVDQLLG